VSVTAAAPGGAARARRAHRLPLPSLSVATPRLPPLCAQQLRPRGAVCALQALIIIPISFIFVVLFFGFTGLRRERRSKGAGACRACMCAVRRE